MTIPESKHWKDWIDSSRTDLLARNEIVETHWELASKYALRCAGARRIDPSEIPTAETLISAVERFNPASGVPFVSYLKFRIGKAAADVDRARGKDTARHDASEILESLCEIDRSPADDLFAAAAHAARLTGKVYSICYARLVCGTDVETIAHTFSTTELTVRSTIESASLQMAEAIHRRAEIFSTVPILGTRQKKI